MSNGMHRMRHIAAISQDSSLKAADIGFQQLYLTTLCRIMLVFKSCKNRTIILSNYNMLQELNQPTKKLSTIKRNLKYITITYTLCSEKTHPYIFFYISEENA